jgi:hypothetical protein
MDHEVVPRPSKRCDWTLKSSWDDLGLHQGKNSRVTTEVHKFVFLGLLYPLPWSNGFSVGTSKRGGIGKIARAHVIKMPFLDFFNDLFSDLVNDSTFWCMVILHGPHSVYT